MPTILTLTSLLTSFKLIIPIVDALTVRMMTSALSNHQVASPEHLGNQSWFASRHLSEIHREILFSHFSSSDAHCSFLIFIIFIVFLLHESPSRPQMCSTDCDILEINHNFTFHTCHSLLMLNVIPISLNVTTCHTLLLMWDYWFCQLVDQLSEVCSSNGFVPQTSGQTQIYHSSCRGLGCCCNIWLSCVLNFEVNSSNHKLWQISGNYEEKWIVEKQGDALWWFSRDWHWSPWWALVANTRLQWGTTLIKGNTLCFVKHFMLQRHCAIVQQSLQC